MLTPLAFDPSHPFPHISNLSTNLAVVINDPEEGQLFARVKAVVCITDLKADPLQACTFESDRRGYQGFIGHLGAIDLAGSGTAQAMRVRIGWLDISPPARLLKTGRAAKEQHQLRIAPQLAGPRRRPAFSRAPTSLFDLHC